MRIGIFALDAIGDFVLTTPLIFGVRSAFPEARIVLCVSPAVAPLAERCCTADQIVAIETPPIDDWNWLRFPSRLLHPFRIAKSLRELQLDIAIAARRDVDRYASSAVLVTNAPMRIGFSSKSLPKKRLYDWMKDFFFTVLIEGRKSDPVLHESVALSMPLESLSFPLAAATKKLISKDEEVVHSEELLSETLPLRVAVCIGANAPKRRWPPERFSNVIRELLQATEFSCIFVGTGGDFEEVERIRSTTLPKNCINLCGRTSLPVTTAVLAKCDLLLCNDSGPMHIAEAVGTPVVAVSCHASQSCQLHRNAPERFGPTLSSSRMIRPMNQFSPCANACEALEPHCILGISVDEVVNQAEEVINELRSKEKYV